MRWPCGLGASLRVYAPHRAAALGVLIASLAAATSAAVICAKSFFCSTSRSETVMRASISISDFSLLHVSSDAAKTAHPEHALRRCRWLSDVRAGAVCGDIRRKQPIEITALAEENAETPDRTDIECSCRFTNTRVQRPVEIIARADTAPPSRAAKRIEHRARSDRNPGRAQRAREVENVFGETCLRTRFMADYSAARSSACTWSSSSFTLPPSSRRNVVLIFEQHTERVGHRRGIERHRRRARPARSPSRASRRRLAI